VPIFDLTAELCLQLDDCQSLVNRFQRSPDIPPSLGLTLQSLSVSPDPADLNQQG
jgi:hypothetical protein